MKKAKIRRDSKTKQMGLWIGSKTNNDNKIYQDRLKVFKEG